MGDITEHLVHNENVNIDKMKQSMNQNINAYDKIIQEIYNYNKYVDLSFNGVNGRNGNFADKYTESSVITSDLSSLLKENTDYQKQLLTILDKESQSASKSYNKSADMYRNQKFTENIVHEQLETLKKNNAGLFDGLTNTNR